MNRATVVLLAMAAVSLCGGCTSYYRVIDPTNNNSYYSDKLERAGSGSVIFIDAKTGNEVTLSDSIVREVTRSEFMAASNERPTTQP